MNPIDYREFYRLKDEMPPAWRTAVLACWESEAKALSSIQSAQDAELPLAGYTCLVKDNFDVFGFPTRASSRLLNRTLPNLASEGPMVRKIRTIGLTILGKTQMNEFAYGLDGANPHFGNCPHPTLANRMSGGSSSGSAWAVARNLVPIAFGTDTGGSIRVPSAFCGLYGLRLPPNSWASEGCFPLAPSFDSAGWMTSSPESLRLFTHHLLGLDPTQKPSPLRVRAAPALPPPFEDQLQATFKGSLFHCKKVATLLSNESSQAFNILQSHEAYEIHRDWIESVPDLYDLAVLQRIQRALNWSPTDRDHAARTRLFVSERFRELFDDSDVIALPVSLKPAGPYPMDTISRESLLRFTAPASLAALPVVTIPVQLSPDETSGLQCILPPDRWELVLPQLLNTLVSNLE